PELVHQDFLRLAGGLKGVGIDGAVERGEQELVGEYRELDGEVSNLVERHLAPRKPSGVLVLRDHRVPHEPALDGVLEGAELFSSHGLLPPSHSPAAFAFAQARKAGHYVCRKLVRLKPDTTYLWKD